MGNIPMELTDKQRQALSRAKMAFGSGWWCAADIRATHKTLQPLVTAGFLDRARSTSAATYYRLVRPDSEGQE